MAEDRFELSPGKPNWVRVFTLGGVVELECADDQTAQLVLTVLNGFVSDIVVDRYQRSVEIAASMDWLPV